MIVSGWICRDGSNDNFSWNCGVEGETDDEHVKALRQRQMRNMHMALMLSQGTPMVLMGDHLPSLPPRAPTGMHHTGGNMTVTPSSSCRMLGLESVQ